MTVYEATTKKHFRKIAEFVKLQPAETSLMKCWQFGMRSLEDFTLLKKKRQGLQIFVCEDESKRIRLVWMRERRGPEFNPKEPSITSHAAFIMDWSDYQKKNFGFIKEVALWLTRYNYEKYGVRLAEHLIPQKFMPVAKEIYGNCLTVTRKQETPIGTCFFVRIDFAKFLGAEKQSPS